MPFSFSQLSLYRSCPRQYEFANIKKLPRGISAGESFGSSVHNTLSKWGKLEMGVGSRALDDSNQLTLFSSDESDSKPPTPDAQILSDLWHQSFIVEGYASKEDADAARVRGESITEKYFEWWSTCEREVVAIEKGFSIPITNNQSPITITGRFDRIERTDSGIIVIDYKTSKTRTQQEVDTDLQLSIYALAVEETFGEPCSKLMLLFLRDDGITETYTKRSAVQLEEAKKQIALFAEGIESKEFAPTPGESVCKHCSYRGVCDASVV